MKKAFLPSLLLATILSGPVSAETLFEALATTYKTNHALKGQRAYLRAVDENVAIAKSGYRPNVYLAGGINRRNVDNNTQPMDYDVTDKNVSANVNQNLFQGFQTVNAVRSADSTVKAEQHNLANVEQQVFLSAATAYLDVLRDSAIVELQLNNEQLLKKRLDETIERFNVGEVTRTDVAQSRARYSSAQSERIAAEGKLQSSKATYEMIIGQKPGKLEEPAHIRELLPKSFEEAIDFALKNNYTVKQQKNNLNARIYDVATNSGELLPSVNLGASASRGKNNPDGWFADDSTTDTMQVGVEMRVPLYNSGISRAKIRQSKYNKWRAHEAALDAESQATETVTSSWEYMVANDAKTKAIKDQIKANEIALDGVQKEEYVGNRTILDVLNAYQELLSSNVEEATARRDYYVSSLALLASMGKLTARSLQLDVERYNAKAHSKETRKKWLSTGIDEE